MKQSLSLSHRTGLQLAVFQLGLLLCPTLPAAVTFTVTPAAVSNTYSGAITLQVNGLTNTETVVVQKFLDRNTNGAIDAGDWLVQQFKLTDGQAGMVIGGVTNINVPGDTDPTAGQITAKLSFRNGDFIQNLAGQYAFKLSSPGGHFAPITNFFSVTNFPYPQKFTGKVVLNGTSTTVPNAIVLLFPPPGPGDTGPGGPPLAGGVANNAGSYTIPAPLGTYMLVAFKDNYLASFATPPLLALGSGATVTTNLTLANATSSISGKLVDANNSSIGLPGILVTFEATNALVGVGFTDTNGNFSLGVQSGQWGIRTEDTSLVVHGYLGLGDRTKANAGQTGVTIAVPKATALVYGRVKDNLGNPMLGIDVYANDNNNYLYETVGYTDTNGNYVVGVLGGLNNDPWWIGISHDTGPANYLFSQPDFGSNHGINISANTATQINFTAVLAPNHISGSLKDNSGNPIVGVGVWANATINGVNYNQGSVNTDANGNYSLNVANGTWSVGVNCSGGSDSLDNILGNGNYQCPNNNNVTINNNNGTANFTVQSCDGVQILTTNLPDGQVGSYYDIYLQASSCGGSLNWSLNDPQDFPSSLGWSGNGRIQGTPDSSGTYNFSVHLDDGNGHSANQNLSLYIAPNASPLAVATTYLPDGTMNAFYSQTLQASGGQPPYGWSVPNYSADPPSNLSLATNGVLSGTLATNGGPFYFDVAVTDGAANVAYQTLSLYIGNPPLAPLVITNVSLPDGTIGAAYSAQLGATGGQPSYSWQLAAGSANLPAGLTLNSSGLITGTPTTNKVFPFKVQVTDANSVTTNKVLSITINSQLVLGSPSWLTNQFQMRLTGMTGQNYTIEMSTNLRSTNWISLFITNNATTNSFLLTDPNATNKQGFYRVNVKP